MFKGRVYSHFYCFGIEVVSGTNWIPVGGEVGAADVPEVPEGIEDRVCEPSNFWRLRRGRRSA